MSVASTAIEKAYALHAKAMELRDQGKPKAAVAAATRALSVFQRELGPKHPDVANTFLELSVSTCDLGDYAKAHELAEQAWAILSKLRGDPIFHQLRASALGQLGAIHVAEGDYRGAAKVCRRALKLAESYLSPREVADALNGLGIACKYLAKYDEAETCYKRALKLVQRLPGEHDLFRASLYHNLGGLDYARERFAKAEPHARKSLELRNKVLGPSHLEVASGKAALAAILVGRNKYDEASTLYREALRVFMDDLGPEHFEVGFNLANLAALYQQAGDPTRAIAHYDHAIPILTSAVGGAHPFLAQTLVNFAVLKDEQGETRAAHALYRRALKMYQATLGEKHPDTRALAQTVASFD